MDNPKYCLKGMDDIINDVKRRNYEIYIVQQERERKAKKQKLYSSLIGISMVPIYLIFCALAHAFAATLLDISMISGLFRAVSFISFLHPEDAILSIGLFVTTIVIAKIINTVLKGKNDHRLRAFASLGIGLIALSSVLLIISLIAGESIIPNAAIILNGIVFVRFGKK